MGTKGNTPIDFGENGWPGIKGEMTPEGLIVLTINPNKIIGESQSGKSKVIASTVGNQSLPGIDPAIKWGINVYKMLPKENKKVRFFNTE
jgi:hypothetical protein